ncbi:MAG: ACT domain-containing protein [Myxococcales bacterium]|nr:ACT domain-containing protein [Myxococcales bacterium]MDH3485179.1 ACT domain-containing protein [Myxococcales bacterium]
MRSSLSHAFVISRSTTTTDDSAGARYTFAGAAATITAMNERLHRITKALEEADRQLVGALNARAKAIQQYRALRSEAGDEPLRLPKKAAVISAARALANEFPAVNIEPVFREVLSACTELITPDVVAYFGSPGGPAHAAAREYFGHAPSFRPTESVREALDAVLHGHATFAVVPLETSTDGAITATLTGLVATDAKLCAERSAPLRYQLLSQSGDPAHVVKVYGAAPAMAACERQLRSRYPDAIFVDVQSGEAAAHFALADDQAAAVGTGLLRELHELRVIDDRIEDDSGVRTRFGIVGDRLPSRTGQDRTILAMAPGDEPGALHRALQPLADRKINLTRIESRPSPTTDWQHVFFLELDGHITDRDVLTAVEELRRIARHAKVIGSYPRPA